MDSSADVVAIVERLGGVATSAQLLEVVTRSDLDSAIWSGAVRRLARGRYATHAVEPALAAARAVSGVICGLSAAQWWGWALKWPPKHPQVMVPRNRSRATGPTGVRIERRDLPDGAIVDGIVTSRAQTVLDCARLLPFDEALSVADSALREGVVDRSQLLAAAEASPRSGRARVLRVVSEASGEAANPFESCTRAAATDVEGLRLEPQVQVDINTWVDLADETLRIVVECESWEFHSGDDLFRRDVRRYTELVRSDWLVLRFVWEDAMHRPALIRQTLADVVALRRAHGSQARAAG